MGAAKRGTHHVTLILWREMREQLWEGHITFISNCGDKSGTKKRGAHQLTLILWSDMRDKDERDTPYLSSTEEVWAIQKTGTQHLRSMTKTEINNQYERDTPCYPFTVKRQYRSRREVEELALYFFVKSDLGPKPFSAERTFSWIQI